MTISKWWSIGIGILLIVFVTLGGCAWLAEHDAKLKAEAQSSVQQKGIDAAKSDAAQTAAQLKQTLAALESQKSQPATPQQIILDTSKLIPLPQPITIQTAPQPAVGNGPAQPGNPVPAKTSDAKQIVIPEADFQAIQNAEIGCQENSAKLGACALTSADLQAELKATEAQRDTWEKTAKGGSWLHKTLTAAKWIGIGVATGYVTGKVTK